jgi:homocysteine S-methyltransferase
MSEKQKRVVILDGGTGMGLVKMGHTFINGDALWSAAVVSTNPEDLIRLHKEFYLAGADVCLSATYQASVEGYKKRFGCSDSQALDLVKQGVQLTRTARDEAEKETGHHGLVAASVGPYGATHCDMSEYHGRYADSMTREELSRWHLPRLKALVDSQPDLLAIETIPVVKEAEAILDNLHNFPDIKAWVTFQCKDGHSTGHGESIKEAVQAVTMFDSVAAVGVNCVHPDDVTSLLQNISELSLNVPVVVKPNAGLFAVKSARSAAREKLSDYVLEWLNNGATWIGGCCHVYPQDISDIQRVLLEVPNVTFLQNGDTLV